VKCVVCSEAMIVLEVDQVEVDFCTACGGIWLDAGELELFLGDDVSVVGVDSLLLNLAAVGKGQRQCPICRKKMNRLKPVDHERPEIDRCPYGHGFWFDRNELHEVIRILDPTRSKQVADLLRRMFGKQDL